MDTGRSLADWLAYIESIHPAEIELGLARVKEVAVRLELLPFLCPVITVAGTNGKGSTVTLLENLLRHSGLRTGLYTSPHILRFNERVKLDGQESDDDWLVQAFEDIEHARGEISLTYFEYTTLAALHVFREQSVEVAVLEVGLGGRLDAVNIVDADVAVVTSIGLDHTDWLGDTRELIAIEKAGIARRGKPLLYGEVDRPQTIDQVASDTGSTLLCAGQHFGVDGDRLYWAGQHGIETLGLDAEIQLGPDNLATAVQAIRALRLPLPDDLQLIASNARLAGRCQRVTLPIGEAILDIGHNAEALTRFLRHLPPVTGRRLALCGMLSDKPAARSLESFKGAVAGWYLATLSGPRGRSAEQLAECLPEGESLRGCFSSVENALSAALAELRAEDQLLIFGSFHTVSEASAVLVQTFR